MAATNIVLDSPRPVRLGNTGFGMMSGTFVDTAVSYADALAVVSGHFQASPVPRIVYIANGVTNGYSFIAMGRAI